MMSTSQPGEQLEPVERLAYALHGLDLAAHVVGLEADAHADARRSGR